MREDKASLRRGFRFARMSALALAAAAAVYVAGFFLFLSDMSHYSSPSADEQADGIVVLTGGHARVDEAVKLLSDNKGKRLLISGVHPSASWKVLLNTFAVDEDQFACCVDIDRKALDTIGNAEEAARWASGHGFKSLIVVTSDYHMPRSLLEMRRTMTDADLIPHAVVTGQRGTVSAGEQMSRYRVLFSEYVKYSAARVRTLLPATGPDTDVKRTALTAAD